MTFFKDWLKVTYGVFVFLVFAVLAACLSWSYLSWTSPLLLLKKVFLSEFGLFLLRFTFLGSVILGFFVAHDAMEKRGGVVRLPSNNRRTMKHNDDIF